MFRILVVVLVSRGKGKCLGICPFHLAKRDVSQGGWTVTLGDNIEACKYKASAFLIFF